MTKDEIKIQMNYVEPEVIVEEEVKEVPVFEEEPPEPEGPKIVKKVIKTIKPRIYQKEIIQITAAEDADTRFDHDNGF